ncbi:MAG: hypothetical protein IE917_20600 [Betaproteobacteria bacterium]|nr:hypothetical protein [Betaproteobacteria bacterium]
MNSQTLSFISAALLFAAWFALVLVGKAPAGDFVSAIGMGLTGLGIFHARGASK